LATEIVVEENERESRLPEEEPIYDDDGKITNTLEQRVLNNLLKEREILQEFAYEINSKFQPPQKVKLEPKKLTKKNIYPNW